MKLPPLVPTPRLQATTSPYTNKPNTNKPILKTPFTKTENQGNTRPLTREERDDGRKRGLCMWCGDKYTREHSCVKSQLYQLLTEETVAKEAEMEEFADCMDTMEEPGMNGEESGTLHAISLHAVVGTEDQQTMCMKGRVKNQSLVILVDSGSSHNFMNQAMVKRLNCEVQTIAGLNITVANGEIMKTQGMCRGVVLEVQGFKQVIDFFILPLQGCDVVLGIQW